MELPIITRILATSTLFNDPASAPMWLAGGLAGVLVLFLIALRRWGVYSWYFLSLALPPLLFSELYYFAFLLGMTTALAEVIGKFSDEPIKSLGTPHAVAYLLFNGLIAAFALHVLMIYGTAVATAQDQLKAVIVAGLGSMLIMRSKLFNIKVGGEDVAFGPDQIIKVFLRFMEAEIDRVRAQTRIDLVRAHMSDIDFDRVRNYSMTMLQAALALDDKARQACEDGIRKVTEMPLGADDRQLKAYHLGFILLNTMGENFLAKVFDRAPPEWKLRAPIRDTPVPGLLDRILAPKDDRQLYFAYGQSICSFEFRKRMGWDAMDDAKFAEQVAPRKGRLSGYRLEFAAPAGDDAEGIGLPTLVLDGEAEVEGVVYRLSSEQLGYLDTEQVGYRRSPATVLVDGKELAVTTYLANRTVSGLRPDAAYLRCMLDGAREHGLSDRYVERLDALVGGAGSSVPPLQIVAQAGGGT